MATRRISMGSEVFLYITGSLCIFAVILLLYCTCKEGNSSSQKTSTTHDNQAVPVITATHVLSEKEENISFYPDDGTIEIVNENSEDEVAQKAEKYIQTWQEAQREQKYLAELLLQARQDVYDAIIQNSHQGLPGKKLVDSRDTDVVDKTMRTRHAREQNVSEYAFGRAVSMPATHVSSDSFREIEIREGLVKAQKKSHRQKKQNIESLLKASDSLGRFSDPDSPIHSYISSAADLTYENEYKPRQSAQTTISSQAFRTRVGHETNKNLEYVKSDKNRKDLARWKRVHT